MTQVEANRECQWKSGVPFNILEKWNCEETMTQNSTLFQVSVYTRSPTTIPAIKCKNITRTMCTKAFLWFSFSVISYYFRTVNRNFWNFIQRQIDGKKLIQISHNKWTATNQVHYYGWLGVRCQATTNLVLTEGEIFLYDGHRFVSDFEIAENCATQDGKCITNTSTRRTNNKKMSYSEVGIFKAQMYENHVIIDELQTSFVFSKENKTFRSENCNFTNPSLMNEWWYYHWHCDEDC